MELVSIVIPVYNSEVYLRECLQSIVDQEYKNIEIIIVNDGSTDGSLRILEEFVNKDSRVRVYSQTNEGVSSARNHGITKASGEYICFVDSDDTVTVNMVDHLLSVIKKNHTDVSFGNYSEKYEHKLIKKKIRISPGTYHLNDISTIIIDDGTMTGILFGSVCFAMYKLDIIKKLNIRFKQGISVNEDGLFNLEYLINVRNISVVDEVLYFYRQDNDRGMYSFKKGRFERVNLCISEFIFNQNETLKNSLYPQLKLRLVSIALWDILYSANRRNNSSFFQKYIQIKSITSDKNLIDALTLVEKKSLNRYKKIYYYLIKLKLNFVLLILTNYILPLLTKKLNR